MSDTQRFNDEHTMTTNKYKVTETGEGIHYFETLDEAKAYCYKHERDAEFSLRPLSAITFETSSSVSTPIDYSSKIDEVFRMNQTQLIKDLNYDEAMDVDWQGLNFEAGECGDEGDCSCETCLREEYIENCSWFAVNPGFEEVFEGRELPTIKISGSLFVGIHHITLPAHTGEFASSKTIYKWPSVVEFAQNYL